MGSRQSVSGAVISVDLELLHSVHPLQCSKALQRDLGRASHKLEEPGPVCLVKRAQSSPKPLDLQGIKIENFN